MNKKVLCVTLPALVWLAGCSSFSEPERPVASAKPVHGKKSTTAAKTPAKKTPPPAAKPMPESVPGTATYAIEPPATQFKLEPSMPTSSAAPLTPPPAADAPPIVPTQPLTSPVPSLPAAPATVSPLTMTAPSAPTMAAYVPEDVKVPSGTSPAVLALLTEADRSRGSGDLDAAVTVMERALRIDSRNPTLTYKLAQLRIKQNKPQLAEELAGKAALLAGNDLELKRKSWLMIAEARRMQQNLQGAKEAKAKADSFFGH